MVDLFQLVYATGPVGVDERLANAAPATRRISFFGVMLKKRDYDG
jgi:hypothetical protein